MCIAHTPLQMLTLRCLRIIQQAEQQTVSKAIMLNKYGLNVGAAYVEQSTLLEPNNFIPSWEAGDEEKKEVSNALRNLRVQYDQIHRLVMEKEYALDQLKVSHTHTLTQVRFRERDSRLKRKIQARLLLSVLKPNIFDHDEMLQRLSYLTSVLVFSIFRKRFQKPSKNMTTFQRTQAVPAT